MSLGLVENIDYCMSMAVESVMFIGMMRRMLDTLYSKQVDLHESWFWPHSNRSNLLLPFDRVTVTGNNVNTPATVMSSLPTEYVENTSSVSCEKSISEANVQTLVTYKEGRKTVFKETNEKPKIITIREMFNDKNFEEECITNNLEKSNNQHSDLSSSWSCNNSNHSTGKSSYTKTVSQNEIVVNERHSDELLDESVGSSSTVDLTDWLDSAPDIF